MHAHAGDRRVQRDRFAELLRNSMMNYVDPDTGERRPLSQRYLAQNVIGVNEQTISRWVRQETAPSPEMVEKVAGFFAWSDENLEAVYGLAQGEELFEDWRIAVGLGGGFPRLKSLMHPWAERDPLDRPRPNQDSRRFFLSEEQREVARVVYESLGSSRAVRTAPGHGATTLARWVHEHASEEAVSRRMIPVLVSLEQLTDTAYEELADAERHFLIQAYGREALGRGRALNPDPDRLEALVENTDEQATAYFGHIGPGLCTETIEAQIRLEIVRSLATQPWERVLSREQMQALFGNGNAEVIEAQRRELAGALGRISVHEPPPPGFWAGVSNIAPSLGRANYLEILRSLNHRGRVRVCLMLDLSPTPMGRQYLGPSYGEHLAEPYTGALESMARALESIEQLATDQLGADPGSPAALGTTFFLSMPAWSTFSSEFKAEEHQAIDFPAFRPIDLFAILANHYPPEGQQQTRGRVEVLAAVLDSEFIDLNEKTAISTEMVVLEQQLKHELSTQDGIAYHLRRTSGKGRGVRVPMEVESSKSATPPGDEVIDAVRAVKREVRELREAMPELVKAEIQRQLGGEPKQKE